MFVALVGPDGSGKTTVARALEEASKAAGVVFWYQHWVPTGRSRPAGSVPAGGVVPPKRQALEATSVVVRVASVARLARNLLRFWIGYLRWIRPLRRSDARTMIVADRWIYNYLGQPYSVGYAGPRRLAELAMRLAPRPDFVAVLVAPGDVVADRKSELTAEQAATEAAVWTAIEGPWWPAVVFDTTRPPREVADDIMGAMNTPYEART